MEEEKWSYIVGGSKEGKRIKEQIRYVEEVKEI